VRPRQIRFGARRRAVQRRHGARFSRAQIAATACSMRCDGERCRELGLTDAQIAKGLRTFEGVARHMELVGARGGARYFDDFAHNPSKVQAAIEAVAAARARPRVGVFQPLRLRPGSVHAEGAHRGARPHAEPGRPRVPPADHYVGGTAAKDISSADIAADAASAGGARRGRRGPPRPHQPPAGDCAGERHDPGHGRARRDTDDPLPRARRRPGQPPADRPGRGTAHAQGNGGKSR